MSAAPEVGGSFSAVRHIELSIRGMTCAACAARIEKKLNLIGSEVVAAVSFATEKATITAPEAVSAQELVAAVEGAGYAAEVAGPAAAQPGADGGQAGYLRRRLILALVFFVPLSDLSIMLSLFPAYRFAGWQWVLVVLAAPVALWAAWPFHRAALKNARHGACSMDTLVSLGVVAACGWSAYAMFHLDRGSGNLGPSALQELAHASGGGIYLEVAAAVTTFLLAGRFYEARARASAADAMRKLAAAAAKDVCVLGADGEERRIPAGQLRREDIFVVRPGEKIAADGEVLSGESAVDRSMMTVESVRVEAAAGDTVVAGTIALSGRLVIRAVEVGEDTQLAHLIALVGRAQADKAAIQRLADRVSGIFVPLVLAAAAVTLAGWLLTGAPAERAFSAGLAVLIIACPCALGLATPAALVAACGRGAQLGIFIKGHHALESSGLIEVVVFDKTGTITTGQMTVTEAMAAPGTGQAELLRYAGAVEHASEHPIAAAISEAASVRVGPLPVAEGFQALPGLGARAVVDGRQVIVGREKLLRDQGIDLPPGLAGRWGSWEQDGRTAVLVGWDGRLRGAFAVADTIKPSAQAAVTELRRLGLRPVLLTGDNEATARAVATAVGIDDAIAGVLPADKAAAVKDLQARGNRVAMVGDGVNDGPALAAADLGMAMGAGTDVAISAADLILLRPDLTVVPDAIALARAARRTIRRNLGWAFGYNVAAVPLAAAGFLNPLIAAAAMTMSSVLVVANSLRLRRFRVASSRRKQ